MTPFRPFRKLRGQVRPKQTILKYRSFVRVRSWTKEAGHFLSNYTSVHQSLLLLTAFILVSNALVVRAEATSGLNIAQAATLDPYQIADTVRIIAPYMRDLNQDPDAIAITLEEQVNGSFISTNPLIATLPGEVEPTPAPVKSTGSSATAIATERSKDIKYTVAIGDTLSGVSNSFDLDVDTIRVKNNLKDVDTIKPGQVLVIPAEDLSEKAIAAADEREKAKVVAAQVQANAKKAATNKSTGYGFISPMRSTGVSRRLEVGHTGVDYTAPIGTPVVAAAGGTVVEAEGGWNGGFGINVLMNVGGGMTLRYAHLSKYVVSPGQSVAQGQIIGYSGNSGRSTGPHLHFELRVNGKALDPRV